MLYPKDGLEAARQGLMIFLDVVFPSLLPFFILSEFFLAFGVVHFLGVLLEPVMRPLFNVPGVGAFALSMGLAAGYPMDAVITARFRRLRLCTQLEAERLLAFTNTADPLFMLGAVAVGMFGRPDIGVLLAAVHYLSSFTVGVLFRYYRRSDTEAAPGSRTGAPATPERHLPLPASAAAERDGGLVGWLRRAVRQMRRARLEDGRSLGQLLNDSVQESMSTMLRIGGFIIFFSVLTAILRVSGLLVWIALPVGVLLRLFGLDPNLASSVLAGLLELDVGVAQAAATASPLLDRLVIASAIIAWSGLSVHGQVASIVQGTDIRMGPYEAARLLHALIAGFYTAVALFLFPRTATALADSLGFVPSWHWLASLLNGGWEWLTWPGYLFGHPAIAFGLLALLAFVGWMGPRHPGNRHLPRLQRPRISSFR
ncbi:MAG: sporulation integral membrane protein YlbJ [Limnochordaceae bacterium]|nr:sporulation integral membrane protein YlbJ [Limnochordaceae bacterium]